MTRKRFVKLLMGQGKSPREARYIAELVRGLSLSYAEVWEKYFHYNPLRFLPTCALNNLRRCSAAWAETIKCAAKSAGETLREAIWRAWKNTWSV